MAKSEFLTAGELRRRGWTGALIRQFAGPADHLAVNPYHPGGPAMRLYQRTRIEEIDRGEQFVQALALADRRRTAAQKGPGYEGTERDSIGGGEHRAARAAAGAT